MNRILLASLAVLALPAAAWAQGPAINGQIAQPRVFNDFSTSTAVVTGVSINPGVATISDTLMTDDLMGGNFANRHDVLLSADGGATAAVFSIDDSFTFQATVNLTVGTPGPRKEAGLRINSPVTGDVQLLVNSDAGEIVAFGGGAPFHLFGSVGMGNPYVLGTPITLGFTVIADGPGGFNSIEYFIDRGLGIETYTPQVYSNTEHGSTNFNVGLYGQVTPSSANDFINAAFTNVTYTAIPEPSTMALGALALMGLAAIRRR
jgi:hypothetical protein